MGTLNSMSLYSRFTTTSLEIPAPKIMAATTFFGGNIYRVLLRSTSTRTCSPLSSCPSASIVSSGATWSEFLPSSSCHQRRRECLEFSLQLQGCKIELRDTFAELNKIYSVHAFVITAIISCFLGKTWPSRHLWWPRGRPECPRRHCCCDCFAPDPPRRPLDPPAPPPRWCLARPPPKTWLKRRRCFPWRWRRWRWCPPRRRPLASWSCGWSSPENSHGDTLPIGRCYAAIPPNSTALFREIAWISFSPLPEWKFKGK